MSRPTPRQLQEWYEAALPGDRAQADALARHLAAQELSDIAKHLHAVATRIVSEYRGSPAQPAAYEARKLLHNIASDVLERRREVLSEEDEARGIVAKALAAAREAMG